MEIFPCYVFKEKEDPNDYLKKRRLSCPVLIVSSSNCLLAVGEVPITTLPKDKVTEGILYLMPTIMLYTLLTPGA